MKNPPYNAGDAGSIPGQGTRIPHATEKLSPRATTTEFAYLESPHATTTEPTRPGARAPQLERSLCATTIDPACLSEDPVCCN